MKTRRHFLRTTGISLALPWLDKFSIGHAASASPTPRRMICICAPLGFYPEHFFPKQTGKDYALSTYLDILKDHRDDFTVISGLQHAGMGSSFAHQASASSAPGSIPSWVGSGNRRTNEAKSSSSKRPSQCSTIAVSDSTQSPELR